MDGFTVIADFINWLGENDEPAIFRGHADRSWRIEPSAYRGIEQGITTALHLRSWRLLAGRFANPLPRNDLEWLVLAQHYGIATPLLDWSKNPLIALFFACLDARNDRDGTVILCPTRYFSDFYKAEKIEPFMEDRKVPALIDTSYMNARTLAQDSVMSLHSIQIAYLNETVLPVKHFGIPAEVKAKVSNRLKIFGFTAERMYSDLTTAALEFKDMLKSEASRT